MACYVLKFDGIADEIRIPSSSDQFDLKTFVNDLNKLQESESFELEQIREQLKNPVQMLDKSSTLFYSGGAKGADTLWAQIAREYGFNTLHYYTQDIDTLNQEEYNKVEEQYQKVAKALGNNLSDGSSYTGKLLRRNMLQVNSADSIFALAKIVPNNFQVDGGTGYAVEGARQLKKPIFVYDLNTHKWNQFDYSKNKFEAYDGIPQITAHAAVIGSRSIADDNNVYRECENVVREIFNQVTSEIGTAKNQLKDQQQIPEPVERNQEILTIAEDAAKTAELAKQIGGIDTLRHPDTNGMHFGNPFSHTNYQGVQKVMPSVKEAVIAFEQWLRGENYQDIEPERRQWIIDQINSGVLIGKPLVYDTKIVPDNSYGRSTYDYVQAPNHAHILAKLIFERQHPEMRATSQAIEQNSIGTIQTTIQTLESNNSELSLQEKKSIKELIGDSKPKVLVASEHTDPVFHANEIKKLVASELAKDPKDRSFHMMYIITKHDGLPLKELAQLPIPKFFHFSITSLGGTKYEPGVMKMDHLLDRISALIDQKALNPNLCTIRIDPIIPGVTKKEDIRHIIERGMAMGIKQYKFSVMDSYGYTSSGEKCETAQDRYIIKKMQELGYDWDMYYGRRQDGSVNFDAKKEYIEDIYKYMDGLADELGFFINTCGEQSRAIPGLKHIKTLGCVNVQVMNAAMGTTDIVQEAGKQRPNCSCYGNKVDALRYDDKCASSCIYCYAKHNSDKAVQYYDENGQLKINRFTEVEYTEKLRPIQNNSNIVRYENLFIPGELTYTLSDLIADIHKFDNTISSDVDDDSVYVFDSKLYDLVEGSITLTQKQKQILFNKLQPDNHDAATKIKFSKLIELINNNYSYRMAWNRVDRALVYLKSKVEYTELEDIAHAIELAAFVYLKSKVEYTEGSDFDDQFFSTYNILLNPYKEYSLDELLNIYSKYCVIKDPTQLQLMFENTEISTPKIFNPIQTQTNSSENLTQNNKVQEKIKTTINSSETVNKLQKYLDVALNQQNNEKPLSEIDINEAMHLVQQQMQNLGVEVHLLDSDQDMENLGFPTTTEAAVKDGKIYVNLSRAKVSSPMHEFMHLVFAVMKQQDFNRFANIMNQLRGIDDFNKIFEEVASSENYNKLIESDQLEEAFVRYLSGILDGEINTNIQFEEFYKNNQHLINESIQQIFGTPAITDLLSFLKQPFANITKYGSELFIKKDLKTAGYSKRKYDVDISGRIMAYIQDNMGDLIQEGECK